MARQRSPKGFRSVGDIAYSSGFSAIVFMLFVVAGSAYIMVAKLGGVGQIYVTFVPVLTMISYALLIWLAKSLRLRDDQAGDNLLHGLSVHTHEPRGFALSVQCNTRSRGNRPELRHRNRIDDHRRCAQSGL